MASQHDGNDEDDACSNASKPIPRIPWTALHFQNETSSPHNPQATIPDPSGVLFSIERHDAAMTIAHITNLLTPLHHTHIPKVCAMGDYFLVIPKWEETLEQRMQRDKRRATESTHHSNLMIRWAKRKPSASQTDSSLPEEPLHLFRDVVLPVVRALQFLHSKSIAFGTLSTNTVALSYPNGKVHVVLRDFSRACPDCSPEDMAQDVYQLGLLVRQVVAVQETSSKDHQELLEQLIQACCHESPSSRPTIRRVHKRLLEWILPSLVTPKKQPNKKGRHPLLPSFRAKRFNTSDTASCSRTEASSLLSGDPPQQPLLVKKKKRTVPQTALPLSGFVTKHSHHQS